MRPRGWQVADKQMRTDERSRQGGAAPRRQISRPRAVD
ncbi:hypothetical protein I551_4014 [Mycobacterium ulcerans str. Harvey]|uniref:Uncharacterized protein n=1 Tax=Mycobacterium ulcerans str. Harvey TaxID=1299332 RepID=A0ABN0QXW0_MYCUL|nr:hypothetical protein I551_4014 [Mycobacterium ulcerans str. Harvey]